MKNKMKDQSCSTSKNESEGNNISAGNEFVKKVFNIKKVKKINKSGFNKKRIIIEDKISTKKTSKRVSAYSKVNFSKLTSTEKDVRLKNLSSLISRLRKKIRNQERQFKNKVSKGISTLLKDNLDLLETGVNGSDNFVQNLISAIKILKENYNANYEDEKHLVENLAEIIALKKLDLNSINFKKICTQVRLFLQADKINYISSIGKNITFQFEDKDISITPLEYDKYSIFKNNEPALKAIFGLAGSNKDYPNKIIFEKEGQKSFNHNTQDNNINDNCQNLQNINSYSSFNPYYSNSVNINNNVLNQLISMYPTNLMAPQLLPMINFLNNSHVNISGLK